MAYCVKEIFYTLQGEGAQTGRPAVFCRFSGCNLWSGREEDRSCAICTFCDTDFVGTDGTGGGIFDDAHSLAYSIRLALRPDTFHNTRPFVVLTGGEPALQVDDDLVESLHETGFDIAIETNGTVSLPNGLDWITVSPKAGTHLVIRTGNELKLVYPQKDMDPEFFETFRFSYFYLQPADGPDIEDNTQRAVKYCLSHPRWRLSLQIHKVLGIP